MSELRAHGQTTAISTASREFEDQYVRICCGNIGDGPGLSRSFMRDLRIKPSTRRDVIMGSRMV